MTIASLAAIVREILSIDESYEATSLPAGLRRNLKKLLRDYHFPKSVRKEVYFPILGQQDFLLPDGFKKDLSVRWFSNYGGENAWSDPLGKFESFELPDATGLASKFRLEGLNLITNTPLSSPYDNTQLWLFYESMDLASNEDWFLADFEDILLTYSVYRLSMDYRKPEVTAIYANLWAEERQAIAIYLNELEFDNQFIQWREPNNHPVRERYPR